MDLQQTACSVLLISSSEKLAASVSAFLPKVDFFPVHKVKNLASAERMLADRTYDYVIINSPLSDDTGVDFAIDTGKENRSIVLLLVSGDIHDEIFDKVSKYGVFTAAKPITRQTFELALRWLSVVRIRSRKTEAKTLSLEEKMAEIRIVNRAKLLLISEEQMDEESAHHFIEKQAMDHCRTRREIAQQIIDNYS